MKLLGFPEFDFEESGESGFAGMAILEEKNITVYFSFSF